jgi:homoserine O-succinyltransferase
MAAHAAVYRIAGIRRKGLDGKLSGLYECKKSLDHPLLEGVPESWFVPQSRYNGLPEHDLLDAGFDALTRLDAGLDTFILKRKSLFLFFQGHPEYDAESLLLEYVRDVKRFAAGERDVYPNPPEAYFDFDTLRRLDEIRAEAHIKRNPDAHLAVTRLIQGHKIKNVWKSPSTTLYGNWLKYIAREKAKRLELA